MTKKRASKQAFSAEESRVLDALKDATGRNYRTLGLIGHCLDRGSTAEECCLVIAWWAAVKIREDPAQDRYFDNETPFRESKFDKYLAAAEAWHAQGRRQIQSRNGMNGQYDPANWHLEEVSGG